MILTRFIISKWFYIWIPYLNLPFAYMFMIQKHYSCISLLRQIIIHMRFHHSKSIVYILICHWKWLYMNCLAGNSNDRWRAIHTRVIRHCWTRRLRSTSTIILPSDRRLLGVLLGRRSSIFRERPREGEISLPSNGFEYIYLVGAWDCSSLPEDAFLACWNSSRSPWWSYPTRETC